MRRSLTSWLTILAIAMMTLSTVTADDKNGSATAKAEKTTKEKADKKAEETEKKGDAKSTAKALVPVFSLGGLITESPQSEDPFFGNVGAESLKDLVARLEKARDDKDVKGVMLLVSGAGLGNGQLEEVYTAIEQIRNAGKPVYGHADSLSFRSLVLMSACSRISIAPVGDVMILGMYGEQPHLRGVMDKLHITPDFLTCGEYKSAGELYTRHKPSPEAERMYDWLYDGLFDACIGHIADGREVPRDKVRKWVDHGLYSAKSAAEAGIIDAAEFRADFVKHIEKQHGEDVKLDKRYGKGKRQTIDFGNPFAVFKIWGEILSGGTKKKSTKDAVGIVYVEGPILPGKGQPSPFMMSTSIAYSTPIRKALDKLADDDSIKAVVLRVNSPGGSAVASEIILQATKRVAKKKPFVVSMGNVAGSGGYYVACGAETIFADATTITGSIGVVAGKLATGKMWEKVGVGWHPVSRGKNSGMLSSGDVFTDDQRELLQGWMDEVYEDFKGHVTRIRGDRLRKPIDEIAGGRVYTGSQSLELGLIDRIGGLSDAIKFAAKQAKLEKYEVRIEPRPKSFIEVLMEESSGGGDQQISLPAVASRWRTASLWKDLAPLIGNLEPERIRALQRAFVQLEVLQREGVTLAMPEIVFSDN